MNKRPIKKFIATTQLRVNRGMKKCNSFEDESFNSISNISKGFFLNLMWLNS